MTLSLKELSMLTTLLTQPHRHYHNINHINFCLGELEKCDDADHETHRIVTYAIWYHDAIYNPYSSCNEEQSCLLFSEYHTRYASPLTPREIDTVRVAIEATSLHHINQTNLPYAAELMLDIDLAGLGQTWDVFTKHGEQIRLEYAHVYDEIFVQNRIKFFELLKERPSIYYTKELRTKYEHIAQLNVDLELKRLESY